MLRSSLFLRLFALLLALAAWLAPGAARGDAPAEGYGLVVFGDALPREDLRARLSHALGRPVTLVDANDRARLPTVTVTLRRNELAVAYDEPGRGTVSRVVPARPNVADDLNDAVLLATSLVHDEADELLGKPAPPSPPTPTPTSAPVETGAGSAAPAASTVTSTSTSTDYVPIYASLIHPIATNFDHPYARTRVGIDLLYGRVGELDSGLQLGTINVVTGKEGVANGRMSGVQLAPFFGFNYVSGAASGLQLAMLGNVAAGGIDGLQLGGVNVAGDVQGAQIGVLNVGQKVHGFMLGLVNVADDVDGVPVGLVSVTRTGGVHPIAWASTATYANAGVKFATRHTYTMIAAHYTNAPGGDYAKTDAHAALHLDDRDFVGGGFFVGGRVPLDSAPLTIEFDVGFSGLIAPSRTVLLRADGSGAAYHEVILEPHLRVTGAWAFAEHASLFMGAGAVLRARIVNDGQDALVRLMPEFLGGVQF